MASEQAGKNPSPTQDSNEKVTMPDFSELWKELYFRSESAWGETFREFLSTSSFVDMMNSMLEQNLFSEKLTRTNWNRYFETSPLPTKHDVSRVAELVISLEEKIDNLEFSTIQSVHSMADSLLKMVEYQETLKNEIGELRKENKALSQKLDALHKSSVAVPPKPPKGSKKSP